MGHCGSPLLPFVYLFHLPLFFFVSGYFYKEKYTKDGVKFVKQRIKTLWLPYVKYGIIFVLLHNFFIDIHVYDPIINEEWMDIYPYTGLDVLKSLLLVLSFQQPELMPGPIWFVVVLFFAMIVLFISNKTVSFFPQKKQILIILLISILSGALGCYFLSIERIFRFRFEVALLIQPIIFAGFICHRYWSVVTKYINLITGTIFLILLIVYAYVADFKIDISSCNIENPLIFYTSALFGICFCLCLSHYFNKVTYFKKIIGYTGENSFHIMALHFLSFKIISYIYVIVYEKPIYMIAEFPYIKESNWWVLYTIAGVVLPLTAIGLLRIIGKNVDDLLKRVWTKKLQ
jgi:fucose 4-O-acetylase-like acetyltransferase